MRKPKIGFIKVTCPTHKKAINEVGEAWVDNQNLKKVGEVLKNNFTVIENDDMVASFFDLHELEKKYVIEDVDAVFVYISTWNWVDQIAQFIRNINKPIILYTLNDSKAWSIGGLAATHGALDEIGIKHRVVFGDIDNVETFESIKSYAKAAMAKNILRKSRYGSIGGQGMGILTGIIDANQWLKDFGIITSFIDQYSLVIEAEKIPENAVKDYYEELKRGYKKVPELNKIFINSIRLSIALEKIIEKEKFDFTGVKCTFDLSNNYCSACLAQSRLASNNYVSACLNDSNGALSVYILSLLKNKEAPFFTADVNQIFKDKNIIKLIDDGAASIKLVKDPRKDAELCLQPKVEARASGICTKLIARPGDVTLLRLARIEGNYMAHLIEGEVLEVKDSEKESLMNECGFPMWPHALVKIKGSMDNFISNLRSEYIHMAYGNLKSEIKDFCELFDIELIKN